MGSYELFCLGSPATMILLISATCVTWDDRCVPLCPAIG
jgi:hypothetical protein